MTARVLVDNLREQFEFFVNPGEDTRGLCGAVTCVLLPRFEQVAVPAGVIAMRSSSFFILRSTFLRIFSPCDGCASSRCTAGSSAG